MGGPTGTSGRRDVFAALGRTELLAMPDTIEVHTGDLVTVEHVDTRPDGGARFDLSTDDGRKWRIDLTRDGETELVTTWEDGTLADIDRPDWLDAVTARLTQH